jgi:hypothetical protein
VKKPASSRTDPFVLLLIRLTGGFNFLIGAFLTFVEVLWGSASSWAISLVVILQFPRVM